MSYTHRVDYTMNILAGPNKGEQRLRFSNVPSATRAAELALELADGVQLDPWTAEPFTAHNVNIVSFERELPELVEGGGRGWTADEAADFAYDLAQEVR